jgi:hypothetical protein
MMLPDPQTLIDDFLEVAAISGIELPANALTFEPLFAPHKPSALPKGKMAVYVFSWNGQCLKVGKVGPKSSPRYLSQHYSSKSSKSNLAKSLLSCSDISLPGFSEATAGASIRANVDRINFLLDAACGITVLTLLESFLQCRLKPRFEGFESQR